jgi:hypothetical protein
MRPDCYIRAKRGHSAGNRRAKIAQEANGPFGKNLLKFPERTVISPAG